MSKQPTGQATTDERLLQGCLEVVGEVGFAAATTKAIAERAGVNEVTLFRRFSTKAELTAAALIEASRPFRSMAAQPTEDLDADLLALARGYAAFVERWPRLVGRLLAESAGESDIALLTRQLIGENAAAGRVVIEHHIEAERLAAADATEVLVAFLGPILVGATLGSVLSSDGAATVFDAEGHVARFLDGRRN